MINAPGVGSGLDVQNIVRQLMALERRPLNSLESERGQYESQLSAYGRLNSALDAFQTAMTDLKDLDAFEVYSATSADEDVITASANSSASPGTFDIQVVNLAEAHKMASDMKADTATMGGAGDQMTITIGSDSFSVEAGGKTLSEIRDAINDASDNIGVTASVLSESSGNARLILTADDMGTANTMSLSFTGSVGTDLNMATINAAEDSEMLVDGLYTVTRSSNTVTDAIEGVTLELESESATAVNLSIDRDIESVKESVQAFVDAYNELRTTYDELRNGDLSSDATLRGINGQIQSVLNTAPTGLTGSFQFLSEVGVSRGTDGKMSLDSSDLETALNADFSGVAEVFANNDQGYVYRLDDLLDTMQNANGVIDARTDGIQARIDRVDSQILNMEYRLDVIEERYRSQFAGLDALMGQLQSTSSFLSQQL